MPLKHYKPTTPSQRFKTGSDFSDLTPKKKAEKKLIAGAKKRISGRGAGGQITVRRRGGGHKRLYRWIDFKRDKLDFPARVKSIEYDPNRSARIALVSYADGEKRYILSPTKLKVGMTVISSASPIKASLGNSLLLKDIPMGLFVHGIELYPGRGAQLARSAGTYAQLVAKEGKYCHLKLPSGEIRKVLEICRATIGQLSNLEHENLSLGKAGRNRWLGRRPKVRGVAMNPVDHPHGGGEGKTSGGRHPVSPTGKPTKGFKTRKLKKPSNSLILRRRKRK